MRRFIAIAVCFFTLLLPFLAAQEQASLSVPNLIRYEGMLKDAQGAALSSSVAGVTFAIYKQQDGGAPVWVETQNVTTDRSGKYSVLLGGTTASGLPGDLFSEQEQRWLGVQVQGEAEQPRVLLVSVPYAFKAHEAEMLAGHAVSDFVTTENLQSAVQQQMQQSSPSAATTVVSRQTTSGENTTPTDGATNFLDNTTNQVVSVQQNGTGAGVRATAPSNSAIIGATNATAPGNVIAGVEGVSSLDNSYGLFGLATSNSATSPGIGAYGQSNSPNGIGLEGIARGSGNTIGLIGQATSPNGFAIDATELATSGNTAGMVARIYSPSGIGALILNNASGSITGALISARTNAGVQFTVDAHGSVHSQGGFLGLGNITGNQLISTVATGTAPLQLTSTTQVPNLNASLLGGHAASDFALANSVVASFNGRSGVVSPASGDYSFNMLAGALGGSQLSGTYSNALTLSNTSNTYYGNGSNLTGIVPGPGSPNYIQNSSSQQASSNFNISGNGTVGGTLSAHAINAAAAYQIGTSTVLQTGPANDGNVFLGLDAGTHNQAGQGTGNTLTGATAGYSNTTGTLNTFNGNGAGYSNTTGSDNTFTGGGTGLANTTGNNNTFNGYLTGYNNTTGFSNTFTGSQAGYSETGGSSNSFFGFQAGYSTTTACCNTFSGYVTGLNNTSGGHNTFLGYGAGYSNINGNYNTFLGDSAGGSNSTGFNNTFLGQYAGFNNTTGSNDIYIDNAGPNSGTESNTIRIGTGQVASYMAGIYNQSVDGNGGYVLVDDTGKLGTLFSSRRFKEQIADMGDSSSGLMKLRPVTYLYKPEYAKGDRKLQYGLIAEEVADVYPELVAFDKEGQPLSVRYQYLAPMLLNEVQKQYRRAEVQAELAQAQNQQIESQAREIAAQAQQIANLKQQLQMQNVAFEQRLSRLEKSLRPQVDQVAEVKP